MKPELAPHEHRVTIGPVGPEVVRVSWRHVGTLHQFHHAVYDGPQATVWMQVWSTPTIPSDTVPKGTSTTWGWQAQDQDTGELHHGMATSGIMARALAIEAGVAMAHGQLVGQAARPGMAPTKYQPSRG